MGLGFGIRKNLFRIPDPGPGFKKAPDSGSGSATLYVNVPSKRKKHNVATEVTNKNTSKASNQLNIFL